MTVAVLAAAAWLASALTGAFAASIDDVGAPASDVGSPSSGEVPPPPASSLTPSPGAPAQTSPSPPPPPDNVGVSQPTGVSTDTPEPTTASSTASPASSAPPAPAADVADERPANLIFAEALGNGLLYSVDYERLIEAWSVGLRIGAGFFSYGVSNYGESGNLKLASIPIVASYYIGPANHKLQLGLGATILYLDASTDSNGTSFGGDRAGLGVAATAVVGYRYIPTDGGLSFGIGFTPLVRTSSALAWGGVNVGYLF